MVVRERVVGGREGRMQPDGGSGSAEESTSWKREIDDPPAGDLLSPGVEPSPAARIPFPYALLAHIVDSVCVTFL